MATRASAGSAASGTGGQPAGGFSPPTAGPARCEVEQHAAALLPDLTERLLELRSAIAALGAEDVARHALGVHANEHVGKSLDLALDQREVMLVVDLRPVSDRAKLSVHG